MRVRATLRDETKFNASLRDERSFKVGLSNTVIHETVVGDIYQGTYDVTPSMQHQTLETRNKVLVDDMQVGAIPTYEVSNAFGGETYILIKGEN